MDDRQRSVGEKAIRLTGEQQIAMGELIDSLVDALVTDFLYKIESKGDQVDSGCIVSQHAMVVGRVDESQVRCQTER